MFKATNVAARVFERQILAPRPGASINFVRQFYENLVPGYTISDVDCPDLFFRKFTDDGQYLISFSRNLQDIVVYRPAWLSFSFKGENCDHQSLTQKAKKFDSFFTQLYCISLGTCSEFICKDFFLYLENHQFGLFATSTMQNHEVPAIEGAIHGLPSIEKITFHLVRLKDGVIMGEKSFFNDFVSLAHNIAYSMGVFLYEDLLCIMSLRYQTIHILQVCDSGNLVNVRNIGAFCLEDDELFLNSHAQCTAVVNKSKPDEYVHHSANGIHHQQVTQSSPFLTGIKQRLLSFIFRKAWNEEADPVLVDLAVGTPPSAKETPDVIVHMNYTYSTFNFTLAKILVHCKRVQHLKKNFYFHFQAYADLIMWKVQFLDRHHLLIKFGSVDGGVTRSTDQSAAFYAVYNMETTEIVAFYQNASEELYSMFEQFIDHFHANSRVSVHSNFISSHSNNIHALEQLRSMRNKATSFSQFVKKMMILLPYTCQSQSPSPFFDLSLFRYDEKLISATERHRYTTDHPIKFISRRQPNVLKFKIKTGLETGGAYATTKRVSSFLFHPFLPLALSIQQTHMQPNVVNIHLRI